MGAEAARVLEFPDYPDFDDFYDNYASAYYGSAAPARAPDVWPDAEPEIEESPREEALPRERAKPAVAHSAPAVSLFAVFGTLFVGVLLVFVIMAQISLSGITSDTVRLNSQLSALEEQERRLEIEFESVIDMKEVERYSRDTLGMSKPDADQIAVVRSVQLDSAEILDAGDETVNSGGLGSFIKSLINGIRK